MRTTLLTLAGLLAASPAMAQSPTLAGTYEVKFEELAGNCDPVRFTYTRSNVQITTAKNSLKVNVDAVRREMIGIPSKSGKVNAKTPKKLATTVDGIDGKYHVSGRLDDSGVLELVLVAEYTRQDNGKPLCTQSWNLRGVKASGGSSDKDNKAQKRSVFDLPALP